MFGRQLTIKREKNEIKKKIIPQALRSSNIVNLNNGNLLHYSHHCILYLNMILSRIRPEYQQRNMLFQLSNRNPQIPQVHHYNCIHRRNIFSSYHPCIYTSHYSMVLCTFVHHRMRYIYLLNLHSRLIPDNNS